MLRRVLAFFAPVPFNYEIDIKAPLPHLTRRVSKSMGISKFRPSAMLLLISIRSYEKRGMLNEPGKYKFYIYKNGRCGLIIEGACI